ncbi:MAG: DUF4920 domain-containing protein [Deltaproteobacteria bacterium]|nr:DUF4920 domain-containing protein [Deltaproteobacteria bacterium]
MTSVLVSSSIFFACKASPPATESVESPATAAPEAPASGPAANPGASGPWASGPLKLGAPFELTSEVPLNAVLAKPDEYAGKVVLVSGKVERACLKKGCWMELRADSAPSGVRVTFKDYSFFVPLDSAGASARVEGSLEVKHLDKASAEHLAGEGAKLNVQADGTAIEIAIVARAVELVKG